MLIHTKRLIIRDYSPADWQDLQEIFSDPIVMAQCEPAYTEDKTREALAFFINKNIAFAVTLADSGKVIGHALFAQLPPPEEKGIYEIGWIYNRKYWRQGYAFEASCALIDYGFRQLHLRKIVAETIDPVKSVGLMRKLGMSHENTLHSHTKDLQGNWADVYWYGICSSHKEELL